jgi:hypothetical protein
MNNDKNEKVTPMNAFASLGMRADLAGQRYINWLRCSTNTQVDTSPEQQKKSNDGYAAAQNMLWAGDVFANAVSGSQTFNRSDVKEVIEVAKRERATKIVVFELGRATRGGIRHGNNIETEFRRAGLELISSTELIPEGAIGELIKSVKHFANQQQALNISKSTTRGQSASLLQGKRPASSRCPFGLDRLYYGPGGPENDPRAIIRWEGLEQIRFDPKTMSEVARFRAEPIRRGRKAGEKKQPRPIFRGYKKQPDECSRHILGSPERVAAVRAMFRAFYLEGKGPWRIIQDLRKKHLCPPCGHGEWRCRTIKQIVQNPLYLGIEVRHRWAAGLFHAVSRDGPRPVTIDQDELEARGHTTVPLRERDRADWELVEVPHLKEYLPEDVRAAAFPHIRALLSEDGATARRARCAKRRHKSDDSPFVLSTILHSKLSGHSMTGVTHSRPRQSGNGRSCKRVYIDGTSQNTAQPGIVNRRVRADAIEEAVISAICHTLNDREWVAERIRTVVEADNTPVSSAIDVRGALVKERDEIVRRLGRVHRTSAHLTDEELEAIVKDDNARVIAIREELADLDRAAGDDQPVTVDGAVEAVTKRLAALPTDWRTLPNRELKALLRAMIGRLEIDLSNFFVELDVRLPRAAVQPVKSGDDGAVNYASAWQCVVDSPPVGSLKIEKITCARDTRYPRAWCYTCSRHRKAA